MRSTAYIVTVEESQPLLRCKYWREVGWSLAVFLISFVIGSFLRGSTGAVNSRCCIEAVANADNWSKGGANYTGVNPCTRTEQVSRMFEAQDTPQKISANVSGVYVRRASHEFNY